jgi:hypothetical protein
MRSVALSVRCSLRRWWTHKHLGGEGKNHCESTVVIAEGGVWYRFRYERTAAVKGVFHCVCVAHHSRPTAVIHTHTNNRRADPLHSSCVSPIPWRLEPFMC